MRQGREGSLRCYVVKPRFHLFASGHESSQLRAKELGVGVGVGEGVSCSRCSVPQVE